MVSNYHRKHTKELGIEPNVEAYIQSRVLQTTLEAISFEYRRDAPVKNDGKKAALMNSYTEAGDGITATTT